MPKVKAEGYAAEAGRAECGYHPSHRQTDQGAQDSSRQGQEQALHEEYLEDGPSRSAHGHHYSDLPGPAADDHDGGVGYDKARNQENHGEEDQIYPGLGGYESGYLPAELLPGAGLLVQAVFQLLRRTGSLLKIG